MRKGETEQLVLVDDIASTDSRATGVDSWRVSLIHSDAEGYAFVFAGMKETEVGRTVSVLEAIVTPKDVTLRSPVESVALEISPERRAALAKDLEAIRTELDRHRTGSKPASIRPLMSYGLLGCIFSAAFSAVGTAATVVTGAAGTVACVGSAVFTVPVGLIADGSFDMTRDFCDVSYSAASASAEMTEWSLNGMNESCFGSLLSFM